MEKGVLKMEIDWTLGIGDVINFFVLIIAVVTVIYTFLTFRSDTEQRYFDTIINLLNQFRELEAGGKRQGSWRSFIISHLNLSEVVAYIYLDGKLPGKILDRFKDNLVASWTTLMSSPDNELKLFEGLFGEEKTKFYRDSFSSLNKLCTEKKWEYVEFDVLYPLEETFEHYKGLIEKQNKDNKTKTIEPTNE